MTIGRSRKARIAKRRRRRVSLADNDLTDAQWLAIKLAWNGCAYCGAVTTTLQRDTVLAISRGGRYTLENVVPACGSCNASKSNFEVTRWMRLKKLDEPAFLLRFAQINAELRATATATATAPATATVPALDPPALHTAELPPQP